MGFHMAICAASPSLPTPGASISATNRAGKTVLLALACFITFLAPRGRRIEIFRTLAGEKLRLGIVSAPKTLGFLVYRFGEKKYTDFSIWGIGTRACPIPILRDADYLFHPRLAPGRILALTDLNAPNRRIVEVQAQNGKTPLYFDLIPEQDMPIRSWAMTANYIVVSYTQGTRTRIALFDHHGKPVMEIVPCPGRDGPRCRMEHRR